MEPGVFQFIWKYSKRQQMILLVLAFANMPLTFFGYTLVEDIVNEALQGIREVRVTKIVDGEEVSERVKQTIEFPEQVFGLGPELSQVNFLFVLVGIFLANILLLQMIKYVLNVYRGQAAERMLRRLRYTLFQRMFRFSKRSVEQASPGSLIAVITSEVEPLGGFVAECYSLPAMQGGIMLMSLGYLVYADWVLALAAVSLYPIQLYVIPKLQKTVNVLSIKRVNMVRVLSENIGTSIRSIQEVHSNDTSNYELSVFSSKLYDVYGIRFKIFIWKFVIKFVNNFIQQLGPVLFYSIGGYLVLQNRMDLGTLFAAISAHKEIGAPWKELLGYYQRQADARLKYIEIVDEFAPPVIHPEWRIMADPDENVRLKGELKLMAVTLNDEYGEPLVDNATAAVSLDQNIALIGGPGSGREELTQMLARIEDPDRGVISYGGHDLAKLPDSVLGRQISYVGNKDFIFDMTIGENLFYGIRHRPLHEQELYGEEKIERGRYTKEALATANITFHPESDWANYQTAGAKDAAEFHKLAMEALRIVELDGEIYHFGLRGVVDHEAKPDVAAGLLQARKAMDARLADPNVASLIERYDPDKYNDNATVAENLLFGTPVGGVFDVENLAGHPYIRDVIEQIGLTQDFIDMGFRVATTMVELFSDLSPDHELFQQFSFISSDDLAEFQSIVAQYEHDQTHKMSKSVRMRLMSLPFKLIPARHRLGIIDEEMRARLLSARKLFAKNLPEDLRGGVDFFDPDQYNGAATVLDNILFGKVAYGQAHAMDRISVLVHELMVDLNMIDTITEVGLSFRAGIGGARLTSVQRMKLTLARAVARNTDVMVLSDATASMDSATQAKILGALVSRYKNGGLIWSLNSTELADQFDHVLIINEHRIVESGAFADLYENSALLRRLIAMEAKLWKEASNES